MKFVNIEINNFRQYYNAININLETSDKNNIILIGGRNGYGKTNFLLSIVWCLFGDKISLIDENFKKRFKRKKTILPLCNNLSIGQPKKKIKLSFQ